MAGGRRLLYVSPVLPADSGNGLAMRAGMVLRLLARRYAVCLLVVPIYHSPMPMDASTLARLCRAVWVAPNWRRIGEPSGGGSTYGQAASDRFDVVHLFRLASLPFAEPWLRPGRSEPERHLDLDDIESATRRRIAALCRANGHHALAEAEEAEARRAHELEDRVLASFQRVYVCSEDDRRALSGRGRAAVCVLPNALPVPGEPPRARGGPHTLLFAGTLGYYPNADAVRFLSGEVLERLRRVAPGPFRVVVVGSGRVEPGPAGWAPEVEFVGAVPDMAPWLARADTVVVPIRAGGGTRLKVLEAFGYRRPVVSTTVGVEGIAARDGEHLLVADGAEAFAEACARLMADPMLGTSLAERAFDLFTRCYSLQAAARALDACSAPPPRRGWRLAIGWRAPR